MINYLSWALGVLLRLSKNVLPSFNNGKKVSVNGRFLFVTRHMPMRKCLQKKFRCSFFVGIIIYGGAGHVAWTEPLRIFGVQRTAALNQKLHSSFVSVLVSPEQSTTPIGAAQMDRFGLLLDQFLQASVVMAMDQFPDLRGVRS